jgi:hypothetical protein
VPASETVSQAVTAFADAVAGWAADDPRRVSLALARAYATRLDAGDGDWRMGESLIGLMRTLAMDVEVPPDFIDELRARGAAQTIEHLARQARGESLPLRPRVFQVNGVDVEPGSYTGG